MTIQQAAQEALDVQNACNLSGVAKSFADVLDAIWTEARKQGKGTDFVNTHPIVTLFLSKLVSLNQHDTDLAFSMAYDAVKILANEVQS